MPSTHLVPLPFDASPVDAGLASTQRFRVARGDADESRLRPRTDAWPPRRPTAAEIADTVKYGLLDPAEAADTADTMVGMELPHAVMCRRRAQLAAMFAVLATAIVGYVSIIA